MRPLIPVLGLLIWLAPAAPAAAQTAPPRVELFGGFSYLPADINTDFPRTDSIGFQVSATFNVNRWFGILGDLGGQYSESSDLGQNFAGLTAETSVYEYLVGPRFTARTGKVSVFAHGLFGAATGRSNFRGFADTGLAFGGGGGIDVDVSRRIAVRAQFDLLGSFADIVEDNTRFAVGVVVKLGGS